MEEKNFKKYTFLKTLKLKGFKSFARSTTIYFSPEITAIVGPNGCGKSNIVDAIKWVLGEQGFKPLRSKSNEDLIFNGTDKYSPLNMAEVSVIFDADSEIMITRRIFRSGEGQYFLNKKVCRLKDIKETLLDFGLGLKHYAIIDQGQVANILEFSPLEKRRLLEEAAGVTKYRTKKEETLKKIEETKQNLLRLKDILDEVEKQLKKLRAQARRASIYLKTKEKLHKVNLSLLLKRYQKKHDALVEKEKQVRFLKKEKDGLEKKINDFLKEKEKLEKELNFLEEQYKEKQETLWQIRAELKEIEIFFANFKQQEQTLKRQKSSLEEQERNLLKELEDIKDQYEELEKEIEELEITAVTAEGSKRVIEEEIKNISAELNKKCFILEENISNLSSVQKELITIDTNLKHLSTQSFSQAKTLEDKKIRLKELKEKEGEVQNKIKEILHKILLLDNERRNIEEEYNNFQITYEEINERKHHLQKAILKLEETLMRFKSRLKTAKSYLSNYQSKSPPRDDVKAVIDIIYDAQGLENAVEAVLKLKANNGWLIENISTGLKLKSRENRFCLVPLSYFKTQNISVKGTSLLNLIQIKEEYLNAARRLFGNVYLVNELSEDLLNYSNLIFVTPKGEILTTEGIIYKGFSEGLLKEYLYQKKLCVFLEKAIEAIRQKIPYTKKRLKNVKEKLMEMKSNFKQLELKRESMSKEIRTLQDELIKQKESQKYASLQKQEVKKRIIELEQNLKQLQVEKERKENLLKEKNKTMQELEQKINLLKQRIKTLEVDKEEKKQELNKLLWEIDTSKKRFEKLIKEKEKLKEKSKKISFRLKTIGKELTETQSQLFSLNKKYTEKQSIFANFLEKERGIAEQVKELDKRKQIILKQKEKTIQEIEGLKFGIKNLNEKIRKYELDISRLIGELEIIKERLSLDYHISEIVLPPIDLPESELEEEKKLLEQRLSNMQGVNLGAIEEYKEIKERYNFLKEQENDLKNSLRDLERAIRTIDRTSTRLFLSTLEKVNQKFCFLLQFVFDGARGEVFLLEPNHPLTSGVDFNVRLPGKKVTHHLLSMGERCLVSLVFLFSLYFVKPSPFCILDEVDAGLDERNLKRLCHLFLQLKNQMQLIVITHKRATMEIANELIGVTMEEKGISQAFSISLEEKRDVKVV